MPIEEGDQERWDELPAEAENSEGECIDVGRIDRVTVDGETYSYAASSGTILVKHEQEKVPTGNHVSCQEPTAALSPKILLP